MLQTKVVEKIKPNFILKLIVPKFMFFER